MRCTAGHVAIDILPDDVLLEIFDLCRGDNEDFTVGIWKSLVHVCRRWRCIIFASPRRLHLALQCDARTTVWKLLDTWPPLPITIRYSPEGASKGKMNIMAAPGLHDRITGITFDRIQSSEELEGFTDMRFSALTWLSLTCDRHRPPAPIFPESFLDGSTPQLRSFTSYNVAFVAFPKFVLSATRLVTLSLLSLRRSPFGVSLTPEVIASNLAALPTLKELAIGFKWWKHPESRSGLRDPPRQTRIVLLALTHFRFEGDGEHLEDFVSRIDAPLLNKVNILSLDHVPRYVQQLHRLISGAESFKPLKQAFIDINFMWISLLSPTHFLEIRTEKSPASVLSMARLCNDLSHLLSFVDDLEIRGYPSSYGDYADASWLELFRPFIAVQNLYANNLIARLIAPVLQEPTRSINNTSDVLPSLRNLVLERRYSTGSTSYTSDY